MSLPLLTALFCLVTDGHWSHSARPLQRSAQPRVKSRHLRSRLKLRERGSWKGRRHLGVRYFCPTVRALCSNSLLSGGSARCLNKSSEGMRDLCRQMTEVDLNLSIDTARQGGPTSLQCWEGRAYTHSTLLDFIQENFCKGLSSTTTNKEHKLTCCCCHAVSTNNQQTPWKLKTFRTCKHLCKEREIVCAVVLSLLYCCSLLPGKCLVPLFFSDLFFSFLVYWDGWEHELPTCCCWHLLVGVGWSEMVLNLFSLPVFFFFFFVFPECCLFVHWPGLRLCISYHQQPWSFFPKILLPFSSLLLVYAPLHTCPALRKASLLASGFLFSGEYHFDMYYLKPHKVCSKVCPAGKGLCNYWSQLARPESPRHFPSAVLCWLSFPAVCIQQQQLGRQEMVREDSIQNTTPYWMSLQGRQLPLGSSCLLQVFSANLPTRCCWRSIPAQR